LGRPGNRYWSALQTHLQGLNGATLTMGIMPEPAGHAQPSFLYGFPNIDGRTLQLSLARSRFDIRDYNQRRTRRQ
jgi:hypothetical protein